MSETSEITLPRKANFKDYILYAVTGAIIHPIIAGVFSFILVGLEMLYAYLVSNSLGMFTLFMILGTSPLGIFVMLPMFVFAGVFYSTVFGFIYNSTPHGKANTVSNRLLYSIVFSHIIAIISPIVVYILLYIFFYIINRNYI